MKRRLIIIAGGFMIPLYISAAAQESNPVLDWIMSNIAIVFVVMVLIGGCMALYNALMTILFNMNRDIRKENGIEDIPPKPASDAINKWLKSLSGLVPLAQESQIDTGHNYDGIRELDNKLPPWWLYLFYLTIVWSVIYLYVYEYSDIGQTTEEQYAEQMAIAKDQHLNYLFKMANSVNEENVTEITDPARLENGGRIYLSNCMACHGTQGEGGVGPNFTDEYWIHGGDIKDLFTTIKYGVPEKGMISWKTQIPPAAMQDVASYILTLQGTDPPNQKKPEGKLYTASDN